MINKIKLNKVYDGKKVFIYKVMKGEGLTDLSKRFHTTQEVIIGLNGLTEEVSEGDILVIERVEGEEYTVEPLDTLKSLAQKSGKSEFELMTKNNVDFIFVGQKIFI